MTWSFFASLTLQAAAPPPGLDLPVACRLPEHCVIQKLVDHAPGPERQDARCGTLTTDGHKGMDIRLKRYSDMAGPPVPVLAAAAGRVARVRDGLALNAPDPSTFYVGGARGYTDYPTADEAAATLEDA